MSMVDVLRKSTEQAFVIPSQSPPASKSEETKIDELHTLVTEPVESQESAQKNVDLQRTNDGLRDVSAESVASTDTSETTPSASPTSAPSVSPEEKPPKKERKNRVKQPPTTELWQRFSCECSVELVDKLRNISMKENVTLRSLVEKMFRDGIKSYERKHGVAQGSTKRTAEDLF